MLHKVCIMWTSGGHTSYKVSYSFFNCNSFSLFSFSLCFCNFSLPPRCGMILRLVDLYQGEKGNIPPALIIRPAKNESLDHNSTGDKTYTKMGDRNNRPNFLSLLSLLSILIRSGNLPYESEFDVSDSDSDTSLEEKDESLENNVSTKNFSNNFITNNYLKIRETLGLAYKRGCTFEHKEGSDLSPE